MVKRKTRNLAIVLAIIMVVCMMPMTAFAENFGDVHVSIPSGENIVLSDPVVSDKTINYDVVSLVEGYYPFNFSLQLSPYGSVTDTIGTNGLVFKHYKDDYCLVTLPENSSSTLTIKSKEYTYILNCQAPNGGASQGSSNVYAFLPAPGQFTNEGIGKGGWGDIYDSKGVLKHNASTGVSLGFFGGYAVYDFGKILRDSNGKLLENTGGIVNKDTNPYGADFVAYGNAFWENSEPGCIQVSQDGNEWYDIAGSLHYDKDTVWNYSLTYTNPTKEDDLDGVEGKGTLADVDYTGSATGKIEANGYHNHAYFPLNRNYFSPRTINNVICPTINKTSILPFADYTKGDANTAATLTLTGTMLGSIKNSNQTNDIAFGYCDTHPNKKKNGVAYNPYKNISNEKAYDEVTNRACGGDPIDISWAVNSKGEPVSLDCIRFVRIYTGTAAMTEAFGEMSTEVTAIMPCVGTGSSDVAAPTAIKIGEEDDELKEVKTTNGESTLVNLSGAENACIVVDTNAENIFINGIRATSGSPKKILLDKDINYVRVITQSGDGQPYLTLLKISR